MRIILGSKSKGRQQMLMDMGYQFEVTSADIDEKAIRFSDPSELTLALSNAKADALLPKITQAALLITSDQVVSCHGLILEKPEHPEEVRDFFQLYTQHPPQTVTAVTVTNTSTGARKSGVSLATVWMKNIPKNVIEQWIQEGKVFTYAGGFGIQDMLAGGYIEKLEGDIDSVIGLPKKLTRQLLQAV